MDFSSFITHPDVHHTFCEDFSVSTQLTEQELLLCNNYTGKRKTHFTIGRHCAKKALSKISESPFSILKGEENEPIWPESITGSISHSDNLIGALVARTSNYKSIGLDIETAGRVKENMWKSILTQQEIEFIASLPFLKQNKIASLYFSMKEAFYKLQFPITREKLWFHDVEIKNIQSKFHISICKQTPNKKLLPNTIELEYFCYKDQIITYCVI